MKILHFPPCKVLPFSQFSIFRITYLFAKTFPSIWHFAETPCLLHIKVRSESIEWVIEEARFRVVAQFVSTPTPSPSSPLSKSYRRHTGRLRKRDKLLTGKGGKGWAWSRILQTQGSRALYKSFKTLWAIPCGHLHCRVYTVHFRTSLLFYGQLKKFFLLV